MLITLDDVLTSGELTAIQQLLAQSHWAHGEITAGTQSARVKNNQQLPENAEQLPSLRRWVLGALNRNALFFTAALPQRIFPP
ncbi:MAG: PKHD-type hydroxylase, partial [Halothiobacillaceae bacterium]